MYLRPYRPEDFEVLYALDVACFPPRFRFSREMMLQTVTSPAAIVRLACESTAKSQEAVLGFCAVSLEAGEHVRFAYVATLDVAPESRGQGLGGLLMLSVESEAAREGARWMVLHVYVENREALRLYERLGYARVERERAFYGPGYDAWLYRKEIPQTV